MADRLCPLCGGKSILKSYAGYEICLTCGSKFKRDKSRPEKIDVVWMPDSIMEMRYRKVVYV